MPRLNPTGARLRLKENEAGKVPWLAWSRKCRESDIRYLL